MFSKRQPSKKTEDIKKSAAKVLDAKRDTPTRAKHLRIFLDNADNLETVLFFENHYSHIFYIVYDAFVAAELGLRQKGPHKAQREELEAVLYLLEKVLIYLPEHLSRKWQYHAMGRLMSKLLHPGNSWRILKREAMRLFILWYQTLGDTAGEPLHAMFATLVPGFTSPYHGLGLTALAAMTPDIQDGPINPAEICPLIPPQSGDRNKSPETDLTRIFLEVLVELMVSQVPLIEWRDEVRVDRQRRCFNFLFERFKMYYIPNIFPEFNWKTSIYKPALELPEVRKFKPAFVDAGDGTRKIDPMIACRVVVIKWVTLYTHITRSANTSRSGASPRSGGISVSGGLSSNSMDGCDGLPIGAAANSTLNMSVLENGGLGLNTSVDESATINTRNTIEGNLVRDILYATRDNVNFVHEVYRQAFLLSFSNSPAIKKVITVYKDWIQMNVQELPPFLLEPLPVDREREEFMKALVAKSITESDGFGHVSGYDTSYLAVSAGLQNLLQIFVTNAANVFLLEVSPEYPILLEEQVEMCKRVLNIYRYMVMNVKMEARTWEQLLFVLLQITQLTLTINPPIKRDDTLGGRLAQAIFQTLIVTWIKANLYVVVSAELWDQFIDVLSSLTLWEELIREWAKTMETLTRVLARQVYNLDLNDLPLDRLTERAQKKKRGRETAPEMKYSSSNVIRSTDLYQAPQSPSGSAQSSHHLPASPHLGSGNHNQPDSDAGSAGINFDGRRKRLNSEGHHHRRSRPHHKQIKKVRRTLSEGNIQVYTRLPCPTENDCVSFMSQKRSRSLDSMRRTISESSTSRSSSPAPSSNGGVAVNCLNDCGSMKDSPMQLDHDAASDVCSLISDADHGANGSSVPRSVMSGGSVKGWLPDVAVVLWRRMLGALGNINEIKDTVIHAQIYKYLIELFEIMAKIRNNQGVSLDNVYTPRPPEYVPPFTIFAPWCFRALQLENSYQRGRLYALRLLCMCTVRRHDAPLPKTHLVQFYKVLHSGLTEMRSPDIMNTLVRFTGSRFFSLMLPGYTAYLLDFLFAANCIISSSDLKGVPRTEATSIVGALLPFPTVVTDIPLLSPNPNELSLISSVDLKEQIIGVLLKSGKKEPAGLARCISLSSLGIFVYSELLHETFHPKIREAIQVLLTALRFNNKAVAQIASDMLLLLADHVKNFLDYYPEVPKKIIEVLARALSSLTSKSQPSLSMTDDEKRLLLSLLTCLGEWCMRMPSDILTHPTEDGRSLLQDVFASLLSAGSDTPRSNVDTPSKSPPETSTPIRRDSKNAFSDFDPTIQCDNTKEGYNSLNPSPTKTLRSSGSNNAFFNDMPPPATTPTFDAENEQASQCPVRLAARAVLSHLVNHLFHFPMGAGAASLSSIVSEHDDNPNSNRGGIEELSTDIFRSPNVQLFVLNETTLLSLVEIPRLESNQYTDINVSSSEVRIILRTISGKFSWDATALYGINLSEDTFDDEELSSPRHWPQVRLNSTSNSRSPINSSGGVINGNNENLDYFNTSRRLRHRNMNELPSYENAAGDLDNLDDLLQYIGHTSSECLPEPGKPLNSIPSASAFLEQDVEKEVIAGVLGQGLQESERLDHLECRISQEVPPKLGPIEDDNKSRVAFQQCRRLFSQLGLTSWERRNSIFLLKKSDRLIRELKNLDNKRCRETHKIAVIYVGEGQEDKQSILFNTCGSQAFEDFVSGLAWEVELESHNGFMGGLSKNRTTGETSPYYATSFSEVMFHVATRMPSNSEESLLSKTRHLGNDEIHVVWSEHWRDYRRGILPTEFCDVLIIIYPLPNQLYRIQISRKQDVPYFGPLFNEAIVDGKVLPGLVRATAINASRAKRSMLPHYQSHYEERCRSLEEIINNHCSKTTFEEFVTQSFSPAPLENLYHVSDSRAATISGMYPSNHSNRADNSDHGNLNRPEDLLRPRTRTEVSSSKTEMDLAEDSSSPKNLKKLTAVLKTSINTNVVHRRPLSVKDETLLGQSNQQQSPPMGLTTRRRQ